MKRRSPARSARRTARRAAPRARPERPAEAQESGAQEASEPEDSSRGTAGFAQPRERVSDPGEAFLETVFKGVHGRDGKLRESRRLRLVRCAEGLLRDHARLVQLTDLGLHHRQAAVGLALESAGGRSLGELDRVA